MKHSFIILVFILSAFTIVFAQAERQQNGDMISSTIHIDTTMWKYLSATDRTQWTITKADSEKAINIYFIEGSKIFREFLKIQDKIEKGKLTYPDAVPELLTLLVRVKDNFEQGLKLNPFDVYLRQAIARIYFELEIIYAFQKNDVNRLQILKNLLLIVTDTPSRINLFERVGTIYFKYQLWEQTKENFRLAVINIFNQDESAIDTSQLYRNLNYRGQAYVKLYDADSALISLKRARTIAPTPQEYKQCTSLIEYINWDDGNIRASELFYNTRALVSKQEFEKAETDYLKLLPIIQTNKAKNETQLNLSTIQFTRLNKQEEAISRLWSVVQHMNLDSLSGVPVDSAVKEYWDRYSYMCTQLANKTYHDNKKLSFTYFLKASHIEAPDRGRAYLGLAGMSLNNPDLCLQYCTKAFEYQFQLMEEEKKTLYNLFHLAYRQKGDFSSSLLWFRKYHEI